VLQSFVPAESDNAIRIQTGGLENGVYIVFVDTRGGAQQIRLVKQD